MRLPQAPRVRMGPFEGNLRPDVARGGNEGREEGEARGRGEGDVEWRDKGFVKHQIIWCS